MKPRLTFEQHVALGAKLALMRDELLTLGVIVANAYPKGSRCSRSLLRTTDQLDKARSDLDAAVSREHPAAASTVETYYPDRSEVAPHDR